jgi:hypothetical protein
MRSIGLACVAAAAVCTSPAAAAAATLASDKPCYLEGESATLAGEGYAANAPISFTFDGSAAGEQPSDAAGRVFAGFTAPEIGAAKVRHYTVTAADRAGNTGTTTFAVTSREMDIRPNSAPPRRIVRFSVRGMTPGHTLFAHYVLRGRERARVRLGVAGGPCGTLVTRARFFPQRSVPTGNWTIQVDHRRRWSRGAKPKTRFPVRVFRVSG